MEIGDRPFSYISGPNGLLIGASLGNFCPKCEYGIWLRCEDDDITPEMMFKEWVEKWIPEEYRGKVEYITKVAMNTADPRWPRRTIAAKYVPEPE